MKCVIYARVARDEETSYKQDVYNELLKVVKWQPPMRMCVATDPSVQDVIFDILDRKTDLPVHRAVERINTVYADMERIDAINRGFENNTLYSEKGFEKRIDALRGIYSR